MKRIAILAVSVALTGCAFHMRMLEDGHTYQGVFDPAGGKMSVDINGDTFAGPLYRGVSPGIGAGVAGTTPVVVSTFGGLDQFYALLTNASGTVMRCQIQSIAARGQGICQTNSGRTLDVLIGDDGTSGTFVSR